MSFIRILSVQWLSLKEGCKAYSHNTVHTKYTTDNVQFHNSFIINRCKKS